MRGRTDEERTRLAAARVSRVTDVLADSLPTFTRGLHSQLADAIPELRGDPIIHDMLRASTESNIEAFLHIARYEIAIEDVTAPSAAVAYARRLAQRGISSSALLRAYRVGQQHTIAWLHAELERQEPDRDVAYTAARLLDQLGFAYVDHVAEQVVVEYEQERERWLTQRCSARAAAVSRILDGRDEDVAAAEQALGYRLRQHHVGVVLWSVGDGGDVQGEHVLSVIMGDLGCAGGVLYVPQDRNVGWGWVPLGRSGGAVDLPVLERAVRRADPTLRVALGRPAADVPGFRATNLQARSAYEVASVAAADAAVVTSYDDPRVRLAALLALDLPRTRELVDDALGGLAAPGESAERLRETLLVFLEEKRSFQTTGERLHLHRNSVKYRVDRAVEVRGRSLDEDRLNLEVALVACQQLGRAVLREPVGE